MMAVVIARTIVRMKGILRSCFARMVLDSKVALDINDMNRR